MSETVVLSDWAGQDHQLTGIESIGIRDGQGGTVVFRPGGGGTGRLARDVQWRTYNYPPGMSSKSHFNATASVTLPADAQIISMSAKYYAWPCACFGSTADASLQWITLVDNSPLTITPTVTQGANDITVSAAYDIDNDSRSGWTWIRSVANSVQYGALVVLFDLTVLYTSESEDAEE